MNLLKEISDIDMDVLMELKTSYSSVLFTKTFCTSISKFCYCDCSFVYTKTKALFFKTRFDIVRIRDLYRINDIPNIYIDMIIYDKLSKL